MASIFFSHSQVGVGNGGTPKLQKNEVENTNLGRFRIQIGNIVDDILLDGHDLIVNPTNKWMIAGGGVCGSIFKKAGLKELEEYTSTHFDINNYKPDFKEENTMKVFDIRVTPGFKIPLDILFVQGPKRHEYSNQLEILSETYNRLLDYLANSKYHNVLLPSLGTGIYGFTHEEVGSIVKDKLSKFVTKYNINIDLVLLDEKSKKCYL